MVRFAYERLRAVRTRRGLTLEQAAELFGVTRQAVGQWETGVITPRVDTLVRVLNRYNLQPGYLFPAKGD